MKSKENINQRIIIPCRITVVETLREDASENPNQGVKIKGKLITAGVPTRNGISYTAESLAKFVGFFNKNKMTMPFLDSHDDSSIRHSPPFGHVEGLSMQGNDVFYIADIDPEEKMFLHKLQRGDIREVSLQAIVDSVGEQEALDGGSSAIVADVKELLEISSVLIPGARGTSTEIQESLGFMTEQRFAETFKKSRERGITFKECYKLLKENTDSVEPDKKDTNNDTTILGGAVGQKTEDLTSANGSALIGKTLPKDKKIEKICRNAQFLKITTRRLS